LSCHEPHARASWGRGPTRRSGIAPLEVYLAEIARTPLLKEDEERELAARVTQGDEGAREQMIHANLRLVVNIARGWLNKGVELDDLIQEGNLGLTWAVENFDPSMGTRFTTYASYWIKQSIRKLVVLQGKDFRVPLYMVNLVTRWREAALQCLQSTGFEPSAEEVGSMLGLSSRARQNVVKTMWLMAVASGAPLNEADIKDTLAIDEEDPLTKEESLAKILGQIDQLTSTRATVMKMLYGLPPFEPMSTDIISAVLGMSKVMIRKIESESVAEMREILRTGSTVQ